MNNLVFEPPSLEELSLTSIATQLFTVMKLHNFEFTVNELAFLLNNFGNLKSKGFHPHFNYCLVSLLQLIDSNDVGKFEGKCPMIYWHANRLIYSFKNIPMNPLLIWYVIGYKRNILFIK